MPLRIHPHDNKLDKTHYRLRYTGHSTPVGFVAEAFDCDSGRCRNSCAFYHCDVFYQISRFVIWMFGLRYRGFIILTSLNKIINTLFASAFYPQFYGYSNTGLVWCGILASDVMGSELLVQ